MNQVSKDEGPSGLSIASLVTGLLSMGVIAIILGSIDLVRIGSVQSRTKGKGIDIAGIVLGSLSVLFGIAIAITILVFSINYGLDGTFFGVPVESFCS